MAGWMSEQFRVQVGCYTEPDGRTYVETGEPVEVYHVALPHSCDTWDITEASSRERAVADLKAFIEELRQALEELECRPLVRIAEGEWDHSEKPRSFP